MQKFKMVILYSSDEVDITVKLKVSLLLHASLHICPLTFITEALHLVATVGCSFCR